MLGLRSCGHSVLQKTVLVSSFSVQQEKLVIILG